MNQVTEATISLSTNIRPQAGTLGKTLSAKAETVLSAIYNLVRRVNETAIQRFWEWAAIGFAFRGYTPL